MNGGLKQNYEYRAAARVQLSGKWGITVLVILISGILTNLFTSNSGMSVEFVNGEFVTKESSVFQIIAAIIGFVISGPLTLGVTLYFMKLVRAKNGLIEDIFGGFKKFGPAFLLSFLTNIFSGLWAMLFALPGVIIAFVVGIILRDLAIAILIGVVFGIAAIVSAVIASLRYSMAYYIMNDNSGISALGAIRASKEMMRGNKGKLFMLGLSFIGWYILGFLALFIGTLWVGAYHNTATAYFYEDLKNLNTTETQLQQY